jgi:hypothetical protein
MVWILASHLELVVLHFICLDCFLDLLIIDCTFHEILRKLLTKLSVMQFNLTNIMWGVSVCIISWSWVSSIMGKLILILGVAKIWKFLPQRVFWGRFGRSIEVTLTQFALYLIVLMFSCTLVNVFCFWHLNWFFATSTSLEKSLVWKYYSI